MAVELSQALSWAFDHAEDFGGDPSEVGPDPSWHFRHRMWPCLMSIATCLQQWYGRPACSCWHALASLPIPAQSHDACLCLSVGGQKRKCRLSADHRAGPLGGRAPVVHGAAGPRARRAAAPAATPGGGRCARGCAHARALHRHGRRVRHRPALPVRGSSRYALMSAEHRVSTVSVCTAQVSADPAKHPEPVQRSPFSLTLRMARICWAQSRPCDADRAGVALLSTMSRAVAGADYGRDGATAPSPEAFAAQSPARLLAAAVGAPPARFAQQHLKEISIHAQGQRPLACVCVSERCFCASSMS